jgi:hypothetical protein
LDTGRFTEIHCPGKANLRDKWRLNYNSDQLGDAKISFDVALADDSGPHESKDEDENEQEAIDFIPFRNEIKIPATRNITANTDSVLTGFWHLIAIGSIVMRGRV